MSGTVAPSPPRSTPTFGSSIQQQVAIAVLGSAIAANGLVFLILLALYKAYPVDPRIVDDTAAGRLLGALYQASPAAPAAAARAAARAGVTLHPLTARQLQQCLAPDQPPNLRIADPVEADPGDTLLGCAPGSPSGISAALRVQGGQWFGIAGPRSEAALFNLPHRPRYEIVGILLVTLLPATVLCIWASRRVTAPLTRLADLAERIDAQRGADALPAQGALEIRLLAEAINRLILRLKNFADEQRRLVASVSHDLRTPLTRLRLRAELVPEPALRDKLLRDLQTMQIIVDSCLSLVSAQQIRATCQDLDLGALLATMTDDFADAGHAVQLDGPDHLAIRGDPVMLTRALANVVDNALKFAGDPRIQLRRHGTQAIIDIADTGPGIAEHDKPRALEAFCRTGHAEAAPGGAGLGLAITKSVVEAHHGTITLLDTVPHGLTVRIELPGA